MGVRILLLLSASILSYPDMHCLLGHMVIIHSATRRSEVTAVLSPLRTSSHVRLGPSPRGTCRCL